MATPADKATPYAHDALEQTTISPHTQVPLVTRVYPTPDALDASIARAAAAQVAWRRVPLAERLALGQRFVEEFEKGADAIPAELAAEMGRPAAQNMGEVRGLLQRARHMLAIAPDALANVPLTDTDTPGFRRFIRRAPLGVVLVIAPWNYPYLTSVNSVLPALIAGNAVLLKPSPQTPLSGERFVSTLHAAGFPRDLVQVHHLSPALTARAVQHPLVSFVSFTGSVAGGRAVERAAAAADGPFKGVALELGGKDPAYVRPDADLPHAVAQLVDGAFYNSGQSCCAVERIYVHEDVYDAFVPAYVEEVKKYLLGDPAHEHTTLGPVVSVAAATKIRAQVEDAIKAGATAHVPPELFPAAKEGTAFVAPQVLTGVTHEMALMRDETFGPAVGIQRVASDGEALALMNDSAYALTASIFTASPERFLELEGDVEAGTVFLNRCDVLDPALAWTGAKESGRGVSLSKFGYDQLTRAKSVHMKIMTS